MKLLLLIILFIIFFPIFKMWMMMRRARRNMEDAILEARRRSQAENYATEKRYDYPTGEYADYEDVAGSRPTANDATGSTATSRPAEEQIVDAEFEDIK